MSETDWVETRHGGRRRTQPRVAQKTGTSVGAEVRARAVATADAEAGAHPGYYLEEHRPDKAEVRGSNPCPWTKKFVLKLREPLGLPECPYVVRWRFETPLGSIRVHHWLASDDPRAKHDHPWWFATFVFKGGYTDASPDGDDHLRAPAVRFRRATHRHTVFPDPGGAWTLMITGPKVRTWGFWTNGRFYKMNKYFFKFGHHPCD